MYKGYKKKRNRPKSWDRYIADDGGIPHHAAVKSTQGKVYDTPIIFIIDQLNEIIIDFVTNVTITQNQLHLLNGLIDLINNAHDMSGHVDNKLTENNGLLYYLYQMIQNRDNPYSYYAALFYAHNVAKMLGDEYDQYVQDMETPDEFFNEHDNIPELGWGDIKLSVVSKSAAKYSVPLRLLKRAYDIVQEKSERAGGGWVNVSILNMFNVPRSHLEALADAGYIQFNSSKNAVQPAISIRPDFTTLG